MEFSKVDKRGAVVLPARFRKRFGIEAGSYIIAEEKENGILIHPVESKPARIYTREEVAEYLLSNSVNTQDYVENKKELRKLGLDPAKINHIKPSDT